MAKVKISKLEVGMAFEGAKEFISSIGGSLIATLKRLSDEEIIETIYKFDTTNEDSLSINYFCSDIIKKDNEEYINVNKKLTKWESALLYDTNKN